MTSVTANALTVRPSLTTVRQPLYEMGQAAAIHLLRIIRNGVTEPSLPTIRVTPSFVKRQSTEKAARN